MTMQPDPAVLAALDAKERAERAERDLAVSLRALHARKDHLDVLIAMLEAERAMQANTGSVT